MKRHVATLAALAIGTVSVLAACSSGGESNSSESVGEVKIAVMSGITTELVMKTGIEKGFFTDEGLKAMLVGLENPPATLAAMQGGSADFAYAPLPTALTALSKGIKLQIIGSADGFPDDGTPSGETFDDTTIFVNPKEGIVSAADLAGQKVAVPSRSGLMEIAISEAVKSAGGDPKSVQWLALDQQSQLTSLTQGRIDAAGLSTPFSDRAQEQGMTLLERPVDAFFQQGAAGVWITTAAFAEANPDVVSKFQKALAATNAYGNEHAAELAQQIHTEQKLDIPVSEVVVGYFPTDVKAADVERARDKMIGLGFLPADLSLDGVVIEPK